MTVWVTLILLASLAAYASNRFSLQSISLAVITALALVYALVSGNGPDGTTANPVAAAFSGFASEALVAIVALMVLGKSLIVSGALQPVSTLLSSALTSFPKLAFSAVLVGGFAISGFLNDTPVVVMLMPIILGAAAQTGASAGAMLMPMNYAVILGGMMTAIGTSTNLLVNALSADNGGPRFDFFDFYLIALPAAAVGLVYLLTVAPWLLRNADRAAPTEEEALFLTSLQVTADSAVVDAMLYEIKGKLGRNVTIRHLMRSDREVTRFPTARVRRGDMLILAGNAKDLQAAEDALGLSHPEERGGTPNDADRGEQVIARRCVVSAGSPIVGKTVRDSAIEWRYNIRVAGLSALDSSSRQVMDVKYMPIAAGDSLLLEGSEDRIGRATQLLSLVPVGEPLRRRATRDAALALIIFLAVILLAVFKILPIAVSSVAGVLTCVATRVLNWEDVERSVEWRIVLIVASSIALGDALVRTGAMESVAMFVAQWTSGWPLAGTVALILTITGVLTNFVSNNAAAAIMTPLALQLASTLGVPAEPLVLAVLFGANMCFLTPMAYQTNLLVMAAAGYRFNDFPKVGLPLFVILIPILTASLVFRYGTG
ncbi:MAG: SLC13 family permease [Burkholderiaceae bacterium]